MSPHHICSMQDYNGLIVTKQLIRAMAHIFYMKIYMDGCNVYFLIIYMLLKREFLLSIESLDTDM